jgi:hypothetical protein
MLMMPIIGSLLELGMEFANVVDPCLRNSKLLTAFTVLGIGI